MEILFIQRLNELLHDFSLSQYALAKKLEINQSTICNWLNGKKEPCIESLWKLADFFDVSLDYLVGRKEM